MSVHQKTKFLIIVFKYELLFGPDNIVYEQYFVDFGLLEKRVMLWTEDEINDVNMLMDGIFMYK